MVKVVVRKLVAAIMRVVKITVVVMETENEFKRNEIEGVREE